MQKIALSLCLLLLAASCTIEKRVYQPGWHLEWKHHRSAQQPDAVSDASIHSPSTALAPPANELRPAPGDSTFTNDAIIVPEQTAVLALTSLPPDSIPKQSSGTGDHANSRSVSGSIQRIARQQPRLQKVVIPASGEQLYDSRPIDPLVILMWILDGLIVAAILLAFVLFVFTGGWEVILGILIGIVLFTVLFINAVLAVIVAVRRKSPDYAYRHSDLLLPVFGAFLAVLGLFLIALLAIIALIFISGGGF